MAKSEPGAQTLEESAARTTVTDADHKKLMHAK